MNHKFNYRWKLKDTKFTKDKGLVFSCFACGGGSTMGYKLAGYDVIGCNEIDKRMMYAYCQNHNPRFPFLEPIQDFKNREDLPPELFNLDILDGSPPCSTFSMAGSREDAWGKMKKFREGQSEQILDTLFFDFIDLAKRLQPKVVIAENVKGLLIGEAKSYVTKIHDSFEEAGYYCQHFLVNGKYMGVPQNRERVFFVCIRKDIAEPLLYQASLFERLPKFELNFNEEPIPFKDVADGSGDEVNSPKMRQCWDARIDGDADLSGANERLFNKRAMFTNRYIYPEKVCLTLVALKSCLIRFDIPRYLGKSEVCHISSFPEDYNFCGMLPHYLCGMSVPPIMMAQVASQVWEQWLSKI